MAFLYERADPARATRDSRPLYDAFLEETSITYQIRYTTLLPDYETFANDLQKREDNSTIVDWVVHDISKGEERLATLVDLHGIERRQLSARIGTVVFRRFRLCLIADPCDPWQRADGLAKRTHLTTHARGLALTYAFTPTKQDGLGLRRVCTHAVYWNMQSMRVLAPPRLPLRRLRTSQWAYAHRLHRRHRFTAAHRRRRSVGPVRRLPYL